VVIGGVFTFTATVTAVRGTAKPTGTVAFTNPEDRLGYGHEVYGTAAVDPDTGTAVFHMQPVTPGFLYAVYRGDANFAPSESQWIDLSFTLGLEASPNPAIAGEPITVGVYAGWGESASVCEGPTFLGLAYSSIGDPPVLGDADVVITLPAGTHSITASHSGCPADPGESDVLTLTVLPAPTTASTPPSPKATHVVTTTQALGVKTTDPPASNTTHPTSMKPSGTTTQATTASTSGAKAAYSDPTSTEPGPELASTGARVGPQITVVLTALALGTLLLLISRRRDRSTRAH
jgi:hypothetical protein